MPCLPSSARGSTALIFLSLLHNLVPVLHVKRPTTALYMMHTHMYTLINIIIITNEVSSQASAAQQCQAECHDAHASHSAPKHNTRTAKLVRHWQQFPVDMTTLVSNTL